VSKIESQLRGRPPAFVYKAARRSRRQLHCERVPLTRLAERFGTPLYVYSAYAIRERFQIFDRAFRDVPHTVCYSVKANSNLSILKLLAGMGSGFDVVSGGELQRVVRADRRSAKKVVFSGVGKTAEEIHAALKAGILLFNVESESELRVLGECARKMKRTAQIAFRVNPDVPAETHPYISTGLQQHKFGVPIEQARELYTQASREKYLRVAGVSVHIGSQIRDVKPFTAAMERVAELVKQLRADGHTIRYVDAGGGLGISYQEPKEKDFADCAAQYAEAITRPLRGLNLHLLLEPGRSIVAPTGALLTRAIYRKTNGNKKFLIVDAAMNDLLRPSLYSAYHEIAPVEISEDSGTSETIDVVGPICETGDFFARDRELSQTAEGDLFAIFDAGAYGMSLASNYNTRSRPAEVLVDGTKAKLIRKRESMADLLRAEI
jgi:diaminopimelate decarboxylase